MAVLVGESPGEKGRGYVSGGRGLGVGRAKMTFRDVKVTHVMRMDWFSRSGGVRRTSMRI